MKRRKIIKRPEWFRSNGCHSDIPEKRMANSILQNAKNCLKRNEPIRLTVAEWYLLYLVMTTGGDGEDLAKIIRRKWMNLKPAKERNLLMKPDDDEIDRIPY